MQTVTDYTLMPPAHNEIAACHGNRSALMTLAFEDAKH